MRLTGQFRDTCWRGASTDRPIFLSSMRLRIMDLIPETVYTITCATFEKKKKKRYETMFGTFIYRDVPSGAFPLELKVVQEKEYFYRIAEPEKALCDKLYTMHPAANYRPRTLCASDGRLCGLKKRNCVN